MKLYSFPQAALEKAIAKRMLTLPPPHKEWFADRWSQKPYKKSFNSELSAWDVKFYDAEAEVLRPMVEGDGVIQLMQKNMPPERVQALLTKLNEDRHA